MALTMNISGTSAWDSGTTGTQANHCVLQTILPSDTMRYQTLNLWIDTMYTLLFDLGAQPTLYANASCILVLFSYVYWWWRLSILHSLLTASVSLNVDVPLEYARLWPCSRFSISLSVFVDSRSKDSDSLYSVCCRNVFSREWPTPHVPRTIDAVTMRI